MAVDASSEALKGSNKMATDRITGRVPDSEAHHRRNRDTRSLILAKDPNGSLARNKFLLKAAAAVSLTAAALGFAKGAGVGSSEHHDNILEVPKAAQKVDAMPGSNQIVKDESLQEAVRNQSPEVKTNQELQTARFSQMKDVIQKSGFTEVEKQEFVQIATNLEKVSTALSDYSKAYESVKEPDGTPTLLALTKAKYGNLDITPILEPGETEKHFWEGRIPFIADTRQMDKVIDSVMQLRQNPNDKFNVEVARTLLIQANPNNPDSNFSAYFNRKPNPKVDIIVPIAKPGTPFDVNRYDIGKAKDIVEKISASQKIFGDVHVYLLPIDSGYIPEGGMFVQGGNSLDSIAKYFPELAGKKMKMGESAIVLTAGSSTLDHATYHEWSHEQNPFDNFYGFASSMNPEQVVSAMIAHSKMSTDSKWTQVLPDSKEMFSKGMNNAFYFSNKDMTPDDYKQIEMKRQDIWLSGDRVLFGKSTLDTTLVDVFAKQTPGQSYYYGDASFSTPDKQVFPMANFVNMEKQKLDQLAASSPVWNYVVSKLRENAASLSDFSWAQAGDTVLPQTKNPDTFWKSLPVLGNEYLLEGLFKNDKQVVNLIPFDVRKKAIGNIIVFQNEAVREMAAEHLALNMDPSVRKAQGPVDPAAVYLNLLRGR